MSPLVSTPSPASSDSEAAGAGAPAVIVTLDGPAGTGKSTLAHRLAGRLGLDHLDTGAMYRAAALVAIEASIDPGDGVAVAAAVRASGMRFDWAADPARIHLGDRDVAERIRDLEVSEVVSEVAAQPEVRAVMIEWQRRIATEHPRLVSEGRDQGSAVFPQALVRFYVTADVGVRAERRVRQLSESGRIVDTRVVTDDIRRRDERDSTRSDSPLVRPEGAIDIDTSNRTIDEALDLMETEVRRHIDSLVSGEGGSSA